VLALLGFGNHHPGQSASATEFHEAVEYIRGNPDDVDGAAARLTAFIEKYPGGPQAEEAKAALVELDAARVQLAQQAMFAALKDECLRLIQQDDFGTALRRIEPYGAALPRDIADMVFAAADAKLSRYIRQAGTALAAKDYAGARKALDLAEKLGVPGFAKTIKQKRQEADSHEANAELWAKWEAAKTESNKLLAKDDHEQAAKALEAVKSCGLPEIERLAADRLSAIEKVRTQAASAAAERVRSALREEVEPHLAARRYAEAKAALAVLSDDGLFRAASEILQAAARDVECLQVFWQGVANRLGSLKEGTGLSLDGKAVRFVGLKDGKMRYGTGQVETAIDLLALSARDVLGILGPELYADSGEAAELRSRAGLFLMLDRDADAAQAWKVLTAKPPAPGDSHDLRRYREMATRTIVLKFEAAEKAAEAAFALFRSDPARQPGDAFRTQHRQTRLYNEHLHDLRLAAAADAVVKRLTTWSNHYYLLIPESATWQAAKTRCEQLGGHLATVTTFQENTFVLREFMKQLPGGEWPSLWLGASDEGHEGRWEWVTGERWGFTSWIRGEPSNTRGREHFLQLWRPREAIGWNDTVSTVQLQSVCEWDAAPRLTLDALRDLAAATKTTPPRPTAADCRKRLAERVTCSFVAAPLSYALVAALNQVQVPYQWERSAKAIGDHALQIVSFQADNQPAGDALKRLLDPLGLRYDVDDKGLILQPIQSLSEKN